MVPVVVGSLLGRGDVWCEFLEEGGEGSSSVAEGEFGGEVNLSHGAVVGGEIKEWVVAEASGASRFGEDLAFDGSVTDGEDVSVAGGGEDAVVACAAFGEWDAGEERDEVQIVALVGV
jgi:hypothetical protein